MGFGNFGIWEMLVIGMLILIFFGPRRLPEISRSLGKALREFKRGVNEIQRELEVADQGSRPTPPTPRSTVSDASPATADASATGTSDAAATTTDSASATSTEGRPQPTLRSPGMPAFDPLTSEPILEPAAGQKAEEGVKAGGPPKVDDERGAPGPTEESELDGVPDSAPSEDEEPKAQSDLFDTGS